MGSGNECVTAPQQMPPRRTKLNSQMTAAAMRSPQGCRGSSPAKHAESKKRPLAHQRPKSREETPKEGGGNADALPHGGILGTGPPKMQEANHGLLTYS